MGATFSNCGQYRYLLTRTFGDSPKMATFIMLNPSTADAELNDQTIRKCIGFSQRWGCGSLQVINLFAVCATDPKNMKEHPSPYGEENKKYFFEAINKARQSKVRGPIVCAWGNHGMHLRQDLVVLKWLEENGIETKAIKITKKGQPFHPLTLSYDLELIPFPKDKARP